MPTYLDALRGVSYTEALLEAAHVAPTSAAVLETFELWHESLAEPIYLVSNTEDFVATKEADADRDAGLSVTYIAAPMQLEPQEENDQAAAPTVSLVLANISDIAASALRDARGSNTPWVLIERVYLSDDTSGPAQLPPLSLLVESVVLTGETLAMTLGYGDPANVSVPTLRFRRVEYPTLQP
jgi:hypothetical protein